MAFRERTTTLAIGAYQYGDLTLAGRHEPVLLTGAEASAELFQVLGTAPVLGRTFRDEEMRPGGNPVAILSHRLWQQRFGAQESILGRTLVLDGRPRSIIGVMPAECRFPSSNTAFWIPLVIDPTDSGDLWGRNVWTVGRLRSGVSIERARAEVRAFTPILRSIFPSRAFAQDWGQEADVIPLHERRVGDVRRTLMVFLAAVGSVM